MRKAFTLLELVIVIVVIGILAIMIVPRYDRNELRFAADQVATHIRYTQHLSLSNDQYDYTDKSWFKKNWRISFTKNANTGQQWAYTIWTDKQGNSTSNPNSIDEIATNPSDPTKLMTAGYSGMSNNVNISSELNLGRTYNISNISFSDCGTNNQTIVFDEIGRPYPNTTQSIPYAGKSTKQCKIKLTHNSEGEVTITIEPETGLVSVGSIVRN